VVPEDGVLEYAGELFTPVLGEEPVIGLTPLADRIKNWTDVVLPGKRADNHWDAYRNPVNWWLLRRVLTP